MDKLDKNVVLVLNRNWQAINVRCPRSVLPDMANGKLTALDCDEEGNPIGPVKWEEWLQLPVREFDNYVATRTMKVRMPTVVVCATYDKVPKRRPKLSNHAVYVRDKGICQYSGRKLSRKEANVDHVIPRAQGGTTIWTNVVLADKKINTRKADRRPEEVGLTLIRQPKAPAETPVMASIENHYNIPSWKPFMIERRN